MDGQRFDAWTRALARELPRRVALKASAGFALAGAVTRSGLRDAAANCADEGEGCGMPCCEGLVCDEGICVVVGSNKCPTLDQSNNCSGFSDPPKCEGNGREKKDRKDKKHGKKNRR